MSAEAKTMFTTAFPCFLGKQPVLQLLSDDYIQTPHMEKAVSVPAGAPCPYVSFNTYELQNFGISEMTQKRYEFSTSECGRPLAPSHEEPGYTRQLRQRLKLVCVNAGGPNATKTTYLLSVSLKTKILMIQKLHRNGFEKLKERTPVSLATGMRVFLKPSTKAEGVVTFLTEELASKVVEVKSWSNKILELTNKLSWKRNLVLMNCYVQHASCGQRTYSRFLRFLEKIMENKNIRRLVVLVGDFNTQIRRKEQEVTNKYGFSKRSNSNGELLASFFQKYGLTN
eukprot:snap_masked-scaffold_22-processed-gene-4.18-mRNA-1 protein AED:1.00 eAED:1.00 QI:0/0/0/0/1/1/3/0/282